jgi:hypothetical protein
MEGGLDDLVLLDFIVQGAAADPKPFGGEFLVPCTFYEHFLQQALFIVNDGFLVGCAGFLGGQTRLGDPGWEVGNFDQLALDQYHGVLDAVFKLAHIARPGVIEENPHGLRAEIADGFALFL